MRILILACRTVENELRLAMAQAGVDYPVLYLDAGLHVWPNRLREAIQHDLDRIENVDVVLMGYGFCGKGLAGVKSDRFKIVVPRMHDCISLLLGSAAAREQCGNDVYFVTKGWLDHEISIIHEYNRCAARYGEHRATSLMKKSIKHYTRLTAIDTGTYNVEEVKLKVETLTEKLNLKFETVAGSLRIFHKLLKGPWDEEFIVLDPGQEIALDDMVRQPLAQ